MLAEQSVQLRKEQSQHSQTLLLLKNLSQAPNEKDTSPNEMKRSKCPVYIVFSISIHFGNLVKAKVTGDPVLGLRMTLV
ncbi:hypothetical protein MKW98_030122 [Papaver atlanticum]|uniref:Uncharacterized protein n=1 Tax=Papaver atlanticum TaxID=357466 RepID=A0AAD4XT13_9MAGN|nr:hypothetical protein MKW98_030122 [Papaver atlanticum]